MEVALWMTEDLCDSWLAMPVWLVVRLTLGAAGGAGSWGLNDTPAGGTSMLDWTTLSEDLMG